MRPSFEKALSTVAGVGGDTLIPKLADQIIPFIRDFFGGY